MNNTQKVSIEILLNGAKQMKSVADHMGQVYHDEKIADFARAAMDDNKETKDFIMEKIRENIPLFLNLKNLRIDNENGLGFSWSEDGTISTKIGKFFEFTYKFHPISKVEAKRGNAGGLYCSREVKPEEIEIVDVYTYTSDTSLPECTVCSAWSLTKNCTRPYYLPGNYDVKTWNKIYNLATWTRAQTQLLWKSFEEAVKSIQETQKQICNSRENLYKTNESVKAYVKIERTI